MGVEFGKRLSSVYAEGRAMSAETEGAWARAFERAATPSRPLRVLDLGSGTGRFTPLLAETFGGPVAGVEPSAQMRAVAERTASHPAVSYLPGRAERLPLPDDDRDLVLAFLVLHHVRDLTAAAGEIARVLRPGGRLLVRGSFPERQTGSPLHHYFPRSAQIEREVFPSYDEVFARLGGAGLRVVRVEWVTQQLAPSLAAFADRMRLRALSIFELLDERETAEGQAALDRDAAAERVPRPVEEDCELFVLSAGGPAAT